MKQQNITSTNTNLDLLLDLITCNQTSYENRKLANWVSDENPTIEIDTCWVDDEQVWETAIRHPFYRPSGYWIVISNYNSKEEALLEHEGWVDLLEHGPLPESLYDIYSGKIYPIKQK